MDMDSMDTLDSGSLSDRLHQHIHAQLPLERDLRITAAETDDAIILSGTVPSEDDRQAATRAAASLAPGKHVQNLLEVERTTQVYQAGSEQWETSDDDQRNPNPEFTSQPLTTDVLQAEDAGVEEDLPGSPSEEEAVMFPPVDPVLGVDDQGNLDVLGGFTPDSMADLSVARSVEDTVPGDEALVDAIRRELREDALTTTLQIEVVVEEGVVHLRGAVPYLEDAESAEAVAARVPGVRAVSEELDVTEMS
jgi:osmotically-inducible protein OsmY